MEITKLENIPPPLLEIPQPPKELWIAGELPSFDSHIYLTVVGTRRPSHYGNDVCDLLIKSLRGYPVVIVSGLALGTDAIAHRAALEAGLPTVAFPGSGLDPRVLYPRSHVRLAGEIVAAGGALLSEFPLETAAALWTFPQRNRLMAGISQAVLITECSDRSGTLITARLTTEYNRDLLVVPSSIFSATATGSLRLLRQGAAAITGPEDLIAELGLEKREKEKEHASPEEQKVLDLLETSVPRDELLLKLSMPIGAANALLLEMEIKGLIGESMGELHRF